MIFPKIDFDGPGDLIIWWSEDYSGSVDPSPSNWTELTDVQGQLPATGSEDFASIKSSLSSV